MEISNPTKVFYDTISNPALSYTFRAQVFHNKAAEHLALFRETANPEQLKEAQQSIEIALMVFSEFADSAEYQNSLRLLAEIKEES